MLTALRALVVILTLGATTAYAKTVTINIQGEIDVSTYVSAEKALATYEKGDFIFLNIDSPGGSVEYGNGILKAIARKDSSFGCYVKHMAASMAAVMTTYCSSIYIEPTAKIMFHLAYWVDENGERHNSQYEDFNREMISRLQNDVELDQMLGEEYFNLFLAGKDIWIHGDDYQQILTERDEKDYGQLIKNIK